jgi:uncharacterized protein YyaL (SSP411 family)
VPHFEKMLYDNAQLIRVFLHLYQSGVGSLESGDGTLAPDSRLETPDFFRRIAVETLEYVRREMTDASGAFYSTQDADSEGHEGKFFVWTPEEIAEVLGEDDASEFCALYDVTAGGNFEGENILNIRGGVTGDLGGGSDAVSGQAGRLRSSRERLFEHREKRIKPFRDEKVLTAWNGLMLAAFAEAAAVLDEPEYLEVAKRNAEFLLREMVQKPDRKEGRNGQGESYALANAQASASGSGVIRLLRTWKDGKAKLNGYIEDYANLADGLIELYQVSGEAKYLHAARELADAMITEFWDAENGGFFFTSNDHEELIVRNKDFFDNATPSGNSVAADVLLKLAKFYGGSSGVNDQPPATAGGSDRAGMYERFATTVLRLAASQVRRFPSGFGRTLSAVEFRLADVKEIAIVGERGSDIEREVWSEYRPFKVVASGGDVPLLEGREAVDGKPTVYVCENFVCQRPVTSAEELREVL